MNIKEINRHYHMIWMIDELPEKETMIEAIREHTAQAAKELSVQGKFKVSIQHEHLSCDSLSLEIELYEEQNAHKLLKALQKRLANQTLFKVDQLIKESIEDEKKWLIVTPAAEAGHDIRLKKLIGSIRETGYYDIQYLYGPDVSFLKKYLMRSELAVIDWGDKVFLIDKNALCQKINLNCEACTAKHEYGCCCGSPCHFSRKNLENYKAHEKEIIKSIKAVEPERFKRLAQQLTGSSLGEHFEVAGFDGAIGECGGRCMLLVREEGMGRCMAHKYALENNLSLYEMMPLSCLMFPFEIIECLNDKGRKLYLLTSAVTDESAENIGRWGSYRHLELDLCCIDEKKHNKEFRKEDYKPVYEVNRKLICHEFGGPFYEAVFTAVKSK